MGVGTTDIELLAAIADRDRAALRELYERHAGWLVLRLSRRCGDADIVNEAVQDTFVAVWRKPSAYQGSGDVAAWLWGIAFRRMLDRVRRRSRWETVAEFIKPGVVASAEDEVLIGIEHSDAGTALDRLSPELKAVVQAMVLDGLTARETASLLGIPAGTVKTRMMRGSPLAPRGSGDMTWHPSPEQLQAYSRGLPTSQAWSIETHVAGCDACRRTALADRSRLDEIWRSTLDDIDTPRRHPIERLLVAIGVPEHLARLLGATPSLTVPWLVAVTAVLGFALAIAWNTDPGPTGARPDLFLFLLLAPVVPVAGVAVAFGPVGDPAHEVAVASPFHGFRLLLIRTVAVVTASMSLALVMALLLPDAGLMTAAWILPALALAATTLAMSTFVSPLIAAAGSVLVWVAGIGAIELGPNTLIEFGWTGQLVFAALLVAAVVVLAARRDTFEVSR